MTAASSKESLMLMVKSSSNCLMVSNILNFISAILFYLYSGVSSVGLFLFLNLYLSKKIRPGIHLIKVIKIKPPTKNNNKKNFIKMIL